MNGRGIDSGEVEVKHISGSSDHPFEGLYLYLYLLINIFLVRCSSDQPFEGLPLKRDRLELRMEKIMRRIIDYYETDNVVERGVVGAWINTQ